MSYICHDCGREFEEPKEWVDVEYYGSRLCSYTCPYCDGYYSEAVECKSCGEYYAEEHEDADRCNNICPKCMEKLEKKTREFFAQFNEDEINAIFENIIDRI